MQIGCHFIAVALLVLPYASANLYCQSSASAVSSSKLGPETGFLSPEKYTNAFFGFSIPLPADSVLNERTFSLTRGSRDHLLLSFHSPSKDLISFTITAREITGTAEKAAKDATTLADLSKPKEIEIAGKRFWTAETPLARAVGAINTAVYATQIDHYVLEFKIVSFSIDTTSKLEANLAQITFFDPSQARQVAGASSKPYIPGVSQFAASPIGKLSAGSVFRNSYTNDDLGFRYEFPQDWVLMSKASGKEFSREGFRFALGNSQTDQLEHDTANPCTKQLLFVRRYLENPATRQFNPMIVLLAADRRCISTSGFPKSADDRETVQEIARDAVAYFKHQGSSPAGPARVRAFENAHNVMIDISQNFDLSIPGQTATLSVFSSMLIMQSGEYWVIWMFGAGDQTELDELRKTKIFLNDVGPS